MLKNLALLNGSVIANEICMWHNHHQLLLINIENFKEFIRIVFYVKKFKFKCLCLCIQLIVEAHAHIPRTEGQFLTKHC